MTAITFDTLKLARKLEAAGFQPKQAADTAEALSESMAEVSGLATKEDILRLEGLIRTSAAETRASILQWMFGAMAAQTGLVVALVKLIH